MKRASRALSDRARFGAAAACVAVAILLFAALHLHRVAVHALEASRDAHLHGDFLLAVLYAEQAAECAPIPPANDGAALLIAYASEAEKTHDAAGASLTWQAYERALASTGRLTSPELARVREGLVRAAAPPPGEAQSAPATARLPLPPESQGRVFSALAALGASASLSLFVSRPRRSFAIAAVVFGLVFAGLGYLV